MKNIHVLPTDKPSRLYSLNIYNGLRFSKTEISKKDIHTLKNIYITSDEEIKDGTWVIQKSTGKFMFLAFTRSESYNKNKDLKEPFTKIILTTDQDLIKDGVQKIDDKFLEWFVKNPICDEIEIEKRKLLQGTTFYKIIIPKEEPKQDYSGVHLKHCYQGEYEDGCKYGEDDCPAKPIEPTCNPKEEPKQDEIIYFQKGKKYIQQDGVVILAGEKETNGMVIIDPKNGYGIGHYSKTWNPKAFKLYIEPKQETPEEETLSKIKFVLSCNNDTQAIRLLEQYGQWQQEISYSKEEVLTLLRKRDKHTMNNLPIGKWLNPKDWFIQFKKK